jgi:ParG protein
MSRKQVPFGANPQPESLVPTPEQWVQQRDGKKKRLTFVIPAELHARMKIACVRLGTSMVAELEALLERHYPPEER